MAETTSHSQSIWNPLRRYSNILSSGSMFGCESCMVQGVHAPVKRAVGRLNVHGIARLRLVDLEYLVS